MVGFLGDGINDAPSLHSADVGISVDSAVDVAREAADIILLEHDLAVLHDGVVEGRRTLRQHHEVRPHGHQLQLRQHAQHGGRRRCSCRSCRCCPCRSCSTTSSTTCPRCRSRPTSVDDGVHRGRTAGTSRFIRRFMLVLGPVSSLFDFLTFAVMLCVFRRRRGALPHGLVRGVAGHPDAGDLRDPHPRQPVRSRPSSARGGLLARGRSRALLLPFTPLGRARLRPPPPLFFAFLGRWCSRIWADGGGEALVLPARQVRVRFAIDPAGRRLRRNFCRVQPRSA